FKPSESASSAAIPTASSIARSRPTTRYEPVSRALSSPIVISGIRDHPFVRSQRGSARRHPQPVTPAVNLPYPSVRGGAASIDDLSVIEARLSRFRDCCGRIDAAAVLRRKAIDPPASRPLLEEDGATPKRWPTRIFGLCASCA